MSESRNTDSVVTCSVAQPSGGEASAAPRQPRQPTRPALRPRPGRGCGRSWPVRSRACPKFDQPEVRPEMAPPRARSSWLFRQPMLAGFGRLWRPRPHPSMESARFRPRFRLIKLRARSPSPTSCIQLRLSLGGRADPPREARARAQPGPLRRSSGGGTATTATASGGGDGAATATGTATGTGTATATGARRAAPRTAPPRRRGRGTQSASATTAPRAAAAPGAAPRPTTRRPAPPTRPASRRRTGVSGKRAGGLALRHAATFAGRLWRSSTEGRPCESDTRGGRPKGDSTKICAALAKAWGLDENRCYSGAIFAILL